MALNVEVWQRTLIENLFPDNSFASKSVDDSLFVNNRRVHIPNAGSPSKVAVNRSTKPATISERTDKDLEYTIDELTSDPVHIPHIDTVELSYDKRASILHNDREELHRVAHVNILERWAKGAGQILRTTGDATTPHTHSGATGRRKKIVRDDVLALMTAFNKQDIPAEDRYLLLDSEMYAQLLGSISESDKYAFFASANAQEGIVGKLYGFNILTRSSVLRLKSDHETLLLGDEASEASECAGALAWQKSCVSRALGEVKMFSSLDDPTYYGDTYSFLVRVGGSHRRFDNAGVMILVEDTAA